VKATYALTREKRDGEPPIDLGKSDPEMLSKARNTAMAIRDGDSTAGILVKGKSSMGAASSSAPSSAPNPPEQGAVASTSTTDNVSLKRSAALTVTTDKAKKRRTEPSTERGDDLSR
jgi:hypothetical protein